MWWMVGMAFAQGTVEAAYPCPNGWTSCEVAGQRLGPSAMRDSEGFPALPGSRMAFLSLEPTVLFSPFEKVSYPEERAGFPDRDPTPPTEPDVDEPEAPDEPAVEPETPEVPDAPEVPDTPEPDDGVAMVEPAVAPPVPEPKEQVAKEQVAPVEPEAVEPEVPAVEVTCALDTKLEGDASIGRLKPEVTACLLARRDAPGVAQTERNAVSRVLMINAFSSGDSRGHTQFLKHHLEKIDQSDPDLCLRYAMIQSKSGRPAGAIRWADTALENRMAWSGPSFVKKVSSTYKLRAAMANRMWQKKAEEAGLSEEKDAAASRARALAKTMTREWLDYVRSAGLDDTEALELCVSTSGAKKLCKD